jgi:transcription initiation factor TFIIB
VVVDNLRAYLQIIDVASILRLDCDISDHAFQLFRDCSSATCLRNRSVEALATAALVQAIREAQEPRTLQEISIAANLPQKEIGKYIKILGEALQLSQPINSNSISVHMPRFCTLLQLNKSAQELATHIGEVVINKCFCTRRNPISISAAAIYLACQLEDKRKTQAEICKITGLTEVTLRKVYKELLENWDDLLPSNYTPAVPPEKAFPMATITSGRSRIDLIEETRLGKTIDVDQHQGSGHWKSQSQSGPSVKMVEKNMNVAQEMDIDLEKKVDKDIRSSQYMIPPPVSVGGSRAWPFKPPVQSVPPPSTSRFGQQPNSGDQNDG